MARTIFTVPTTAERTGDFSADSFTIYDPTAAGQCGWNAAGIREQHDYESESDCGEVPVGISQVQYTPTRLRAMQALTDVRLISLLPGLDPTTAQRFDIRMDWEKSEKQRIFGRFSFDRLFTST